MRDRRIQLKVKIKYLAEEARIIRLEERRAASRQLHEDLYRHRIDVVRYEARHCLLAYAFLRGKEYAEVEASAHDWPNFEKVDRIARRFGPVMPWRGESREEFKARKYEFSEALIEWCDRAEAYLRGQRSLAA